jgi:hypothetical protein
MIKIYAAKFAAAGRAVLEGARTLNRGTEWLEMALVPLAWLPSGWWYLALWLTITVVGISFGVRRHSCKLIGAGALAGALLLLQLESSIILPEFTLTVHSTYLGLTAILGVFTYELIGNKIASKLREGVGPRPGEAAAVFAAALIAATIADHIGARETAPADGVAMSRVLVATFGLLTCWGVWMIVGQRSARVITGGLLIALFCSSVASESSKLLAAEGVQPRLIGSPEPAEAVQIMDLLEGDGSEWVFQADTIARDADQLVVRGPAKARFAYLAISKSRRLDAGTYLVADGVIHPAGGITVGIQQRNTWVAYENVIVEGPFHASLMVPRSGDYSFVLANAVKEDRSPNSVDLSSIVIVR